MRRASRGRIAPAWAALLLAGFLLWAPGGASAARVDVRKVLDTSGLGDPYIFDVAPSGAVLVLTGENVFDAGSGENLFGQALKDPAGLSFAGERIHLLADGVLYAVDGGTPRKLVEAPLKSPVLASDGERTYLGGVTASGRSVLFLYKEGAGHKALAEFGAPIDAMALERGALFFSVGPRIYTLREGRDARLFAFLPGFAYIPSLAVDGRRGVLYFSDGGSIYAVRGNRFVLVRRGLGGTLKCRDGELYVLSRRERGLFRLGGVSDALFEPGTLSALKDPCKTAPMSLYCDAARKRAVLKTAAQLGGLNEGGADPVAAYAAAQGKELARVEAALEKEAAVGAQAVLWGGGAGPKAVGAHSAVATGKSGTGISFWDGSEARVGPDSKAVLDDCGPSGDCRQTLTRGLLYFAAADPAAGGGSRRPRGYAISAGPLTLAFGAARLAVFSSDETTAVVVLEGRVRAGSAKDGSVVVVSGEMIEARRGEALGAPRPVEMERLKRWWEEIR